MILLLTNKEDITADFVVLELKDRGKKFFRFNTEDFPESVEAHIFYKNEELHGKFIFTEHDVSISLSSIKSVWYRRPSLPVFTTLPKNYREFCTRESIWFLNGIWENLKCLWVSYPSNIRFAENKITQLKVASEIGFFIPRTTVTNDYREITRFWNQCNREMIIKPVKVGLVGEKHLIFTNKLRANDIEHLKNTHSAIVPSIYQECIKKKYDIRITVIGKQVFPVEIHSQGNKKAQIDWRRPQDVTLLHKKHRLPTGITNKCIDLVERLGLKFAAIDMVLTPNGKYYFLEINPNGQWAWLEKRTGHKLTEALVDMLIAGE